ncbi:META domain-containing protein [Vibrio sp. 404]|uniref:META domain-containing protein n=1 Tax=Vibrio marinisediminis TaxID=2758441 RepID=A0A7W2FR10_9VIBR|nr:META domain-containing protein [Vibrio marinisediminis]MBA5762619.1 META domain-containing protein [Vibrio marinisediminis]
MKLSLKTLLAALSLPVLVTACATNGDDVKTITQADLQHHNWTLTQVDGKAIQVEEGQQAPNLEVGEKMTANGNAGCNTFFGQAELKDNQFRIEKMGMTMKMCMGESMNVESAFSKTLSDWSDMTLTKDSLTLTSEAHTLEFKLSDWKN